jgi:hypothetical protein
MNSKVLLLPSLVWRMTALRNCHSLKYGYPDTANFILSSREYVYEPQLEFTENQTRSSQLLQFLDIYGTRRFITMFTNPWWWRQYAPLKRRSTIILHGSISQKTILNMFKRAHHRFLSWFRSIQSTTAQSIAFILTLWSRSSSKCYLRIQSVPQREHHTSPLQRSTG